MDQIDSMEDNTGGETSNKLFFEDGDERNLFFVGLTGTGKTSVGWGLAREIGWGFLDLDGWIERSHGKSVASIFNEDGEDEFRRLEKTALQEIRGIQNHVVSLGGGTVMDDNNWEQISDMGVSIWVQGDPDQVAKRLAYRVEELEKRPLLSRLAKIEDGDERYQKVKNEVENMLSVRSHRYSQCDLTINLNHAGVDSSVKQMKEMLRKAGLKIKKTT